MNRTLDRTLKIVAAIGFVAVAVILLTWWLGRATPLESAAEECGTEDWPLVTADEGKSLRLEIVTYEDDETTRETSAVVACVLEELDAPQSVIAKMDSTTAMQGRIEDSWDDYEASWTYHPDNGLQLIIEMT